MRYGHRRRAGPNRNFADTIDFDRVEPHQRSAITDLHRHLVRNASALHARQGRPVFVDDVILLPLRDRAIRQLDHHRSRHQAPRQGRAAGLRRIQMGAAAPAIGLFGCENVRFVFDCLGSGWVERMIRRLDQFDDSPIREMVLPRVDWDAVPVRGAQSAKRAARHKRNCHKEKGNSSYRPIG
jgi:hypothetical protein